MSVFAYLLITVMSPFIKYNYFYYNETTTWSGTIPTTTTIVIHQQNQQRRWINNNRGTLIYFFDYSNHQSNKSSDNWLAIMSDKLNKTITGAGGGASSAVPNKMRLYATWVDRTPSNCIPRYSNIKLGVSNNTNIVCRGVQAVFVDAHASGDFAAARRRLGFNLNSGQDAIQQADVAIARVGVAGCGQWRWTARHRVGYDVLSAVSALFEARG